LFFIDNTEHLVIINTFAMSHDRQIPATWWRSHRFAPPPVRVKHFIRDYVGPYRRRGGGSFCSACQSMHFESLRSWEGRATCFFLAAYALLTTSTGCGGAERSQVPRSWSWSWSKGCSWVIDSVTLPGEKRAKAQSRIPTCHC
jgi:hypothetical protein